MLWRVRSLLPLTVVLVVTLCWNKWHSDAAVISIDFSSEWLKIALVKVSNMCKYTLLSPVNYITNNITIDVNNTFIIFVIIPSSLAWSANGNSIK